MLLDRVAEYAASTARRLGLRTARVFVGLRYSFVAVEGPLGVEAGVAYMPTEDLAPTSTPLEEEPGPENIAALLSSPNPIWKSVGVAYANAVSQYAMWRAGELRGFRIAGRRILDAVPQLSQGRCGVAVVVGHMPPLVERLRGVCREVLVLERNPRLRFGKGVYPDTAAPRIVPLGEVVVITGAALVNDTFDSVVELARGAELRIAVGPTAALHPSLFAEVGVDYVASLRVVDVGAVERTLMWGGGRWSIDRYCEDYVAELRSGEELR